MVDLDLWAFDRCRNFPARRRSLAAVHLLSLDRPAAAVGDAVVPTSHAIAHLVHVTVAGLHIVELAGETLKIISSRAGLTLVFHAPLHIHATLGRRAGGR